MEHKNYNLAYCGRCAYFLAVLVQSPTMKVHFINKIDEFLSYKTINPVDLLFKATYRSLIERHITLSGKILNLLFQRLSKFASPFYKHYAHYLNTIFVSKSLIVDFSQTKKTIALIKKYKIDLLVVNDWWMLEEALITAPRRGSINIHPSALPQYRGALPTLWSLKNQDKQTAVTFIILDAKMDQGDIVAQYPILIDPQDDIYTLEKKVEACLWENTTHTLLNYLENTSPLQKQDHIHACQTAKYDEYLQINWATETAKDIVSKIHLYPYLWPLDHCYTYYQGKKLFIKNAVLRSKTPILKAPGHFSIPKLKVTIYCINGVVTFWLFRDLSIIDSLILFFGKNRKFDI